MPNRSIDNWKDVYYSRFSMLKIRKQLLFLALFSIVGFITLQIPFNKVMGSNVSFTLFDFFGPIAGGFLGPVLGIVSVLGVELFNLFVKQTPLTTGSIIRLFPILFAVLYFALIHKKAAQGKWLLIVPLFCIAAFIAHPIGRQVPYYALMFWLIPVIAYFKKDNLFVKSLGSTFTAHSVGGAAWIWAFNLPASVWNNLIPVVIAERILFAAGIAASYILVKYTLTFLISKKILPKPEFNALF
ncbi:MAG: hypothetical protein UT77_C0002G0105 [Candidatus Daviesbacteria bacterium GW2011_GWC2_40_12]|uniref:Riboflavin transporter n=1 Tax=Candidatus Daviesbacteria bacterium GW2011_GWC2_40_12 TaxID=1618431 RepID=A0A0G0TWU3_9BACT|nr:MAG: hypothetical protein UT45_C0004G0097 [Candidatus Daviesbacteria bacterium GW2011_GWA2_39_33]KKR42452.1 MAG: hypothetical protein UT77_C0002G0105 [Candidatus Daviesbacteria bacterium GW2011_GWC2_40_12]